MNAIIRKANDNDGVQIITILNYYIEHTVAAYPLNPLPVQAWEKFKTLTRPDCLWVLEYEQNIIGFGLLKSFIGPGTFDHTADVGYFILPEHMGKGLGKKILQVMEDEAKHLSISVLVANVSSLNETSLAFQQKMGYTECGRIPAVGKKNGVVFDVVWFYKNL